MKIIIILLSFLFFIGCDNQFSEDSTSGVPSCNQQLNKYTACFNAQYTDSVSCNISIEEGEVMGNRAGTYCSNLHFAPDFQSKCQQVALNRLPEIMKQGLQRVIDRCY